MKKIAILSFAVVAGGASAQVLYAQNGFATGTFNGNTISECGMTPPNFTGAMPAGYSAFPNTTDVAGSQNRNRLADDFTVTGGGWKVTKICVFGISTGGTQNDPFHSGNLKIWSTLGGPTDTPIAQTSTMGQASFTGIYRTFSRGTTPSATTNLADTSRTIWKKEFVFAAPVMLSAGTYWADFQVAASNASGNPTTMFVPYLMLPGLAPHTLPSGASANLTDFAPGNAKMRFLQTGAGATVGWYNPGSSTTNQGFNMGFGLEVKGEVVPEPATMAALGLGLAGIAARRRRKA